MRRIHVSADDLLHYAGLERRHSFWSKSLPIAAGVGAGLVAGFAVTFALLTPARRERVRGLFRRQHERRDLVEPELHSDAPGSELPEKPPHSRPPAHA